MKPILSNDNTPRSPEPILPQYESGLQVIAPLTVQASVMLAKAVLFGLLPVCVAVWKGWL